MVHEIENFFGAYLLYCVNPKYKGRTYIGFTVDPNRRIKQHNTGAHAGGAWRTSGRGPWDMVMIIHGFPNQISALRFEWAWQNPHKSRRLRHVTGKKKSETKFKFCVRVVSEMLRSGPWNRLPLTIRWLKQEYRIDFDLALQPPNHMPYAFGPVKSVKVGNKKKGKRKKDDSSQEDADVAEVGEDGEPIVPLSQLLSPKCYCCRNSIDSKAETLNCYVKPCTMTSHTLCLGKRFLAEENAKEQFVPISGKCPKCKMVLLWGDLIRFKMGCYQNELAEGNEEDSEHWADQI